jgi:hypothetical protein
MKSKISKILGVVVAISTIVSLMVAATALPASAAPTTPNFSQVSSPNSAGTVLMPGVAGSGIYMIAGTADGSTLFAWASQAAGTYALYKSTNFGVTWTNTGAVGAGLTATWTPVALLISPKFATDNIVVFVTAANASISNNAGVSFVAAPAPDQFDTGSITSADIGTSYANGAVTILIGLTAGTTSALHSNVETFAPFTNAYSWTEVGNMTAIASCVWAVSGGAAATAPCSTAAGYKLIAGNNYINVTGAGTLTFTFASGTVTIGGCGVAAGTSVATTVASPALTVGTLTATYTPAAAPAVGDISVYGVKFSANYASDAEILCVANTTTGTTAIGTPTLFSSFNGGPFNTLIGAGMPGTLTVLPTSSIIAMGTDYVGISGSNTLAVGINGPAGSDPGLFRVAGRTSTAAGTATSINASISPTSIAITPSPIASATILVGSATSGAVTGYTAFTATPPTAVAINRQPTGTADCSIIFGGTKVFVGTLGLDSGFSVSTDGGINYNQLSLVNVGATSATAMILGSLTVVDNSNMFLVMTNSAANVTSGYASEQLWVTADGGATWKRTLMSSGTLRIGLVAASPAFATDKTVFVSQGTLGTSSTIAKSTDGGNTFGLAITADQQTAILPINGTNFYYGGNTATSFYKFPNFPNATFPATATGRVFSIAINPKDATNIAVGMTGNSSVYMSTDSGATFTQVGGAIVSSGTDNVYVAFDPNGTLYAEGSTSNGVFRWIPASSTWFQIQAIAGNGSGLAVGADGTLYAADSTGGNGIFRSLYPTLGDPIATNTACEFQQMNATAGATFFSGLTAGVKATGLSVVSSATANNFYTTDTATTATGLTYVGEILGFNDTFIGTPSLSTPADKAQVADQTSTGLAWAAFTGATQYEVAINPASDFSGTAVGITAASSPSTTSASATTGSLTAGGTYYWKVRANSQQVAAAPFANLKSRWSTVRSFVTTVPSVGGAAPTTLVPVVGAVGVDVNTTFSWPVPMVAGVPVTGITSYDFVIAEDQGTANHFAIIDFGDTTTINAYKLKEPLKYNTTYWWEVRADSGTSTGAWTVGYFTTGSAPTSTTTTQTTQATETIIVTAPTNPPATYTIVNSGTTGATSPVIPTYLLWLVIVVGAVLVIAVIVLIVRTRRIS